MQTWMPKSGEKAASVRGMWRGTRIEIVRIVTVERITPKGQVVTDKGDRFKPSRSGTLVNEAGCRLVAWTPEYQALADEQERQEQEKREKATRERQAREEYESRPDVVERKRLHGILMNALEYSQSPPSTETLRAMVRCLPGHENE